jgi:flavodoxin
VPAVRRILLAYFSRAGENYFNGGRRFLDVGNTQVLADIIAKHLDAFTYRIEAAEPYSDAYDATVARNVREQESNARPAISRALPDVSRYDTILVGSPIWNVEPPMIMRTFTEGLDLAGKLVIPFTTHAMSGLGRAVEIYAATCRGATIGEGLAVRGEEVAQAGPAVGGWLRRVGLLA